MDKTGKQTDRTPADRERFLIEVGRQYGAGGRQIGRYLAEKLGVTYYDKTLLSETAKSLGYAPDLFEKADERRPSILRSLLWFNYGSTSDAVQSSQMSAEDIYRFQSEVIKNICGRESCVIVGRTADYVMRHHPRMLSIFLHAPVEERAKRVMGRGETRSDKEAADMVVKHDKARESYYNYFTNRHWGQASNYHLCIDSSRTSNSAILAIVRDMLNLD